MMTFQAVSVLGIPLDFNSSHLIGSAAAPPIIQEVLHNGSANLSSESGVDIGQGYPPAGRRHAGLARSGECI